MSGFHLYAAVWLYYALGSARSGDAENSIVCLAGFLAFLLLGLREEHK